MSMFSKSLNTFGSTHDMLGRQKFIRKESELDLMEFDRPTIVYLTDSANIDNEDGSPIYTVNYIVAVVNKTSDGQFGGTGTIGESLFILSQLQEYLANQGWSVIFGDVDIQTDFDDSGDLVVLSTNITAQFSRGLCSDIALGNRIP